MEDRADDEVQLRRDGVGGSREASNGPVGYGLKHALPLRWRPELFVGSLRCMPSNTKPSALQSIVALDDTDRRVLAEFQVDARVSLAELGRRVGLSPPAAGDRLRRLKRSGVITAYRAEVDAGAIGYSLGVHLHIRPAPLQLATVAELARQTPEVVECHRVTGDDCYVMTAHVRDVEHLKGIIDEFAAYGQTTTSIMQSSPVPRRALTPPDAQASDDSTPDDRESESWRSRS